MTPKYYRKKIAGMVIDPYRIFDLYEITNPCQQHAIKKLLRGLNKGCVSSEYELIEEVSDILYRWEQMLEENKKIADSEEL